MRPIMLTADEAQIVVSARDLLAHWLPPDAECTGFEIYVMEQLSAIVSEIKQPLVPPGSEAVVADILATLVDDPEATDDVRARNSVERGSHLRIVRS